MYRKNVVANMVSWFSASVVEMGMDYDLSLGIVKGKLEPGDEWDTFNAAIRDRRDLADVVADRELVSFVVPDDIQSNVMSIHGLIEEKIALIDDLSAQIDALNADIETQLAAIDCSKLLTLVVDDNGKIVPVKLQSTTAPRRKNGRSSKDTGERAAGKGTTKFPYVESSGVVQSPVVYRDNGVKWVLSQADNGQWQIAFAGSIAGVDVSCVGPTHEKSDYAVRMGLVLLYRLVDGLVKDGKLDIISATGITAVDYPEKQDRKDPAFWAANGLGSPVRLGLIDKAGDYAVAIPESLPDDDEVIPRIVK
jgi:hypothetical protein